MTEMFVSVSPAGKQKWAAVEMSRDDDWSK